MEESDLDIGVYFATEFFREDEREIIRLEDEIWSEVSEIIREREIDLTCLNIAPPSLISSVFKSGVPLVVKDKKLYWEIFFESDR